MCLLLEFISYNSEGIKIILRKERALVSTKKRMIIIRNAVYLYVNLSMILVSLGIYTKLQITTRWQQKNTVKPLCHLVVV